MHLITNKLEVKSDDFFVERDLGIFSGVEYIPFRSADFIAELTALIYVSPTLSGAIEKLTDFAVGQGWQLLNEVQSLQAGVPKAIEYTEQETDAMSKWLAEPQNAAGETLYEVVKKLVFLISLLAMPFAKSRKRIQVSVFMHMKQKTFALEKAITELLRPSDFVSIGIAAKRLCPYQDTQIWTKVRRLFIGQNTHLVTTIGGCQNG